MLDEEVTNKVVEAAFLAAQGRPGAYELAVQAAEHVEVLSHRGALTLCSCLSGFGAGLVACGNPTGEPLCDAFIWDATPDRVRMNASIRAALKVIGGGKPLLTVVGA